MIEALMLHFVGSSLEVFAKPHHEDVVELFKGGKSRVLMYIRWLAILEPETFVKAWLPLIEPIEFDTFKTQEEWIDFFDSLPVDDKSCDDPA